MQSLHEQILNAHTPAEQFMLGQTQDAQRIMGRSELRLWKPPEVQFCRKCVISNQRPSSTIEWLKRRDSPQPMIEFDQDGICAACRFAERKALVDWTERQDMLSDLLNKYRDTTGHYDCIVPGSGGKDSVFASHVLKTRFGMHPLTVTWSPHMYTDVGWHNFQRWIDAGFDNYLFTPNGQLHRTLTQAAFRNLLHPFQPFVLGQKNFPVSMAVKLGIPLVFYGESEAEYGNADSQQASRDRYYVSRRDEQYYIGGLPIEQFECHDGLGNRHLDAYLPPTEQELVAAGTDVRYLGYYLKWTPQDCYYYAVEHTGFEPNDRRTEGTYSKYNSIDDKLDGLHYYTTLIKFGIGRASYDASQEIRNGHLTREEGVALVRRFDQEYPARYHRDVLEYLNMTEKDFWATIDSFRPERIWERRQGKWSLRHEVA